MLDDLTSTLARLWERYPDDRMPTHAYLHRQTRSRLARELNHKLSPQTITTDYGTIQLITAEWIPPGTIILKLHHPLPHIDDLLDRGIFIARIDLET